MTNDPPFLRRSNLIGMLAAVNAFAGSPVFYSGLTPFDFRAFDPIGLVTVENPVIAIRANLPWKDMRAMVADMKKKASRGFAS